MSAICYVGRKLIDLFLLRDFCLRYVTIFLITREILCCYLNCIEVLLSTIHAGIRNANLSPTGTNKSGNVFGNCHLFVF